MKTLSLMSTITEANDIAEAVAYLTEARHVIGEVLHLDSGARASRWQAVRVRSWAVQIAGCRS
jgi:enoyl-[acyl-carrier-protein] reductase (NADH)